MSTRIPKYLQSILNTGEGSDFSIFVLDSEGNKIEKKVHTLVLRQCPYFFSMLDLKGKEAKDSSVTIDNIANEIFDYVLHYIYTDKLDNVTMEQAVKVAVAADYLQLEDLKTAALDSWKASLIDLDDHDGVKEAFRGLIASPLTIKFNDDWRMALESLLIAMHDGDVNFSIAKESASFIEFFIDSFGVSHPCLAAHTLAKWATAVDLKLTKKQRKERKRLTKALLDKISLMDLSLQTLVVLSRTEAFSNSYMLKILQKREKLGDSPTFGRVEYYFGMKTGRIVELEYESAYALFHFTGLDEAELEEEPMFWEFLRFPLNFKTKVKSWLAADDQEIKWPSSTIQGTINAPLLLKQFQYTSGNFYFSVILTRESYGDDVTNFKYEHYYDED